MDIYEIRRWNMRYLADQLGDKPIGAMANRIGMTTRVREPVHRNKWQ